MNKYDDAFWQIGTEEDVKRSLQEEMAKGKPKPTIIKFETEEDAVAEAEARNANEKRGSFFWWVIRKAFGYEAEKSFAAVRRKKGAKLTHVINYGHPPFIIKGPDDQEKD